MDYLRRSPMAIKLRSSPRAALPARKFRYEAPAGNFGINSGVAAPRPVYPSTVGKESFFGILQSCDAVDSFTESEIVVEIWSRQETRKF
jgi:malonate-semialdehyde dehydrogenase (acetylating) / methylmalonate-semialdehyde dehydrogenase